MPRLALVCALVAVGTALAPRPAAQPVDRRFGTVDPAPGPVVRVVADDASGTTVEVTADWQLPLADALARTSGALVWEQQA